MEEKTVVEQILANCVPDVMPDEKAIRNTRANVTSDKAFSCAAAFYAANALKIHLQDIQGAPVRTRKGETQFAGVAPSGIPFRVSEDFSLMGVAISKDDCGEPVSHLILFHEKTLHGHENVFKAYPERKAHACLTGRMFVPSEKTTLTIEK